MNRNEKMILLGNFEGTGELSEVYQEITELLSEELPEAEFGDLPSSSITSAPKYQWQATLGNSFKVQHLANALWNAYRGVLQAHSTIAHQIKLVFKLQDADGNFVRVLFADPYSDKSIYMHCFEENMASAFGRA